MTRYSDSNYLLSQQYRDSSNLDARVALHERFDTNPQKWQPWVFDQLDLPAAARVLELGAGPGWLWRHNTERIPAGWEVTLSDFSPGMVQTARAALAGCTANLRFERIDAQTIPFDDDYFAAVIANHMLYHVPDRPKALAEIRRVLKPGGRLFAATNGKEHMRELDTLIRVFNPAINYVFASDANPFRLENGGELLGQFFAPVELRLYENHLHVTEVEPLVAYALSMGSLSQGDLAGREDEFRAFVTAEMAQRGGAIDIGKHTGLFIAQKSAAHKPA